MDTNTGTLTTPEIDVNTYFGSPHSVILFNDNVHSFEEVVLQVIKAVKCSPDQATKIAMEAHSKGEAVAFTGNKERCEHVDSILAGPPLKLKTDIRES